MRSIEGKKPSVQCPLGRKLFNLKIATEMELVYDKNVVFYMFIFLLFQTFEYAKRGKRIKTTVHMH